MQAIQDTNVDLTVWPTIYLNAPFNQTVLERQWEAVKDAFETYGVVSGRSCRLIGLG